MPRNTPPALLLSAVAAMALGSGCTTTMSGSASADSAEIAASSSGDAVAWVDQVCGPLIPFIRTAGSPPEPSQARDPAALVQNISDYLEEAEDAAETAISGMSDAGPSPVAGGDEIIDRLSGTLSTFQTSFRDARTRIEAVDLNDQQALLTEVPAAVAPLEQLANMPDPIAGLQGSPELDQAAEQAANCQQIEREFGG
jgi:hypothetical protein